MVCCMFLHYESNVADLLFLNVIKLHNIKDNLDVLWNVNSLNLD